MLVRSLSLVFIAALLTTLTGCLPTPSAEEQESRQAYLNSALEEVDVASLGEVLCDYGTGTGDLGKNFRRTYLIAGSDSWEPLAERFEELGYDPAGSRPDMTFARTDGITASAQLIEEGPESDLQDVLQAHGCGAPLDGNLFLLFEESGTPHS